MDLIGNGPIGVHLNQALSLVDNALQAVGNIDLVINHLYFILIDELMQPAMTSPEVIPKPIGRVCW